MFVELDLAYEATEETLSGQVSRLVVGHGIKLAISDQAQRPKKPAAYQDQQTG